MKVLVLVLDKVDCLEQVLEELIKSGIKGGTILDSAGMIKVLGHEGHGEVPFFGSLKMILNEKRPFNKTIFMVLKDEQVITAVRCIRKVLGDLSKPNTGIIFTSPIDFVEGIVE